MIHAWWTITYLRTMGSRYATDDNDYPKPWEGDERLKDITLLAEINRVVKLVIRLAEALEKVPVGVVPKAETIPKLWESVKDLKKENIAKMCQSSHHDTTILNSTITKHQKFVDR